MKEGTDNRAVSGFFWIVPLILGINYSAVYNKRGSIDKISGNFIVFGIQGNTFSIEGNSGSVGFPFLFIGLNAFCELKFEVTEAYATFSWDGSIKYIDLFHGSSWKEVKGSFIIFKIPLGHKGGNMENKLVLQGGANGNSANDFNKLVPKHGHISGTFWIVHNIVGITYSMLEEHQIKVCLNLLGVNSVCQMISLDVLDAKLSADMAFAKADIEVKLQVDKDTGMCSVVWNGEACYRDVLEQFNWKCYKGGGPIVGFHLPVNNAVVASGGQPVIV